MLRTTPIFVISLPRSESRRRDFRAHMETLGLNFEFFDAIDGKAIPQHYRHLIDETHAKARQRYGTGLVPGEVGCALSHALIYQKMVDEGIASAFILEDDAFPNEQFAALVRHNILESGKIQFATFVYQPLTAWRWGARELALAVHAYRPMDQPSSTVCYFLTRDFAQRLVQEALPISTIADWPAPIHTWSGCYCVYPALVTTYQDLEQSMIESDRAALLATRMEALYSPERIPLVHWPTPWRILGRLATLTIIPSLLWPQTFGSVANTARFARGVLTWLTKRLFGKPLNVWDDRS